MQTQCSIPPSFGHWLAGLVDGEGSFNLNLAVGRNSKSAIRPQFMINLRVDDAPVLMLVARVLRLGTITYRRHANHTPMACWRVSSLAECISLVAFFDRFPLRTRKKQDFVYWREAVLERAQKAQLEDGRKYRGVTML